MQTYSKDEMARMIQAYQKEMMDRYGNVGQSGTKEETSAPIIDRSPTAERPDASPVMQQADAPAESIQTDNIHDVEQDSSFDNKAVLEKADENLNYETGFFPAETQDRGFLQVRASTENQAIPIEGAKVTITHKAEDMTFLDRVMITDEDGLTPIISLYTKDRDLSLTPGSTKPYMSYTIDVIANGYYPERFTDVPIYGGVTSVQSVNLIPLAEGSDSDTVLIYPQSGPADL